ncbi:unnamed protein product, partial [Symbiodinium sp. CCMP2456]
MDFTSAFEDVDSPADVFVSGAATLAADSDFLSAFSSGEESAAEAEDISALQGVHEVIQQEIVQVESTPQQLVPTREVAGGHRKYSMAGRVGRGRHGEAVERSSLCAHMRSEKRAKKSFNESAAIAQALQDSVIVKQGASYHLSVKPGGACGMKVILKKGQTKGNRFVRKIHFSKFIKTSFGMNTNNVALAAMMDMDASTVPRLQKTVAGVFMASQSRMLARLCAYCQANPPTCCHHHVKWDETTVSTSLNPGGESATVKSAWSVLVVRARMLISWSSGATVYLRLVMPTIPLMSSAADQVFYGLEYHPSFFTINRMVKLLQKSSELAATLHEVDGAYSNIRLHHHYLAQPAFDPSGTPKGSFLASARCQSHATHLISVSMLSLIGSNLLNRYYGLTVFMRNLGYLLRLQIALQQWLQGPRDPLVPPDPLMSETVDFLRTWHHGRDADAADGGAGESRGVSQFEKRLEGFMFTWNGSFSGYPVHHCDGDRCKCTGKEDAARKMASSFIGLLLTTLPAVPAPNKWTKLFPASDFVGLGILINNYLPIIFDLAFKPVMFSSDLNHDEADPRLVEGLFFHAVQGKRYESSKEFLQCTDAQWSCRCWLLVSEHLRRLVFFWLRNLKADKQVSGRFLICELLDKRTSVVWAVLQNVAVQLLDKTGGGRLCMIWKVSDCTSFRDWCKDCPQEVSALRRILLALSGWIYRRHIAYWDDFPWSLVQLVDPATSDDVISEIQQRWDLSGSCCVPAGWARSLKNQGIDSSALCTEPKWQMLLSGFGRLLQMTIADVECKHALSRHWSDRPYPTLTAKHINAEAKASVHEACDQLKALRLKSACCAPPAAAHQLVSFHQKQIRAKSAYMFFRDDLLQTATSSLNPCSKDFWSDLRRRWDALSAEQRAFYEEKAEQSKLLCNQQRQQQRARWSIKVIVAHSAGCSPMRAGLCVHQSSQIFILTDAKGAETEDGLVRVTLRSGPPLGSQLPWCSQALQHGPLVHETEQSFAKSLLHAAHDVEGEFVTITKMSFQNVDLCRVDVTGACEGCREIVVNYLLSDAQQQPDRIPPGAAAPVAPVLPDAAPAPGFDLLAEVLHGPSRARGRGRGRGRGRHTSSQLRQGLIASLPFDHSSVQDELESELQSLLQQHNVNTELGPEAAAAEHGDGTSNSVDRLLEDPVLSASLPESFRESLQQAVNICREADECPHAAHAVFNESDDEQVQGESLEEDAADDASDREAEET